MSELLVYGLAPGATERWQESLLACFPSGANDAANVDRVKQAASADGFHSFRIAGFVPGELPDFAATVRKV